MKNKVAIISLLLAFSITSAIAEETNICIKISESQVEINDQDLRIDLQKLESDVFYIYTDNKVLSDVFKIYKEASGRFKLNDIENCQALDSAPMFKQFLIAGNAINQNTIIEKSTNNFVIDASLLMNALYRGDKDKFDHYSVIFTIEQRIKVFQLILYETAFSSDIKETIIKNIKWFSPFEVYHNEDKATYTAQLMLSYLKEDHEDAAFKFQQLIDRNLLNEDEVHSIINWLVMFDNSITWLELNPYIEMLNTFMINNRLADSSKLEFLLEIWLKNDKQEFVNHLLNSSVLNEEIKNHLKKDLENE
jgi:hypothetical protein